MSRAIMLQGTASDVGKSVLVAGLCRIFAREGSCAPFKAQNMALNSGITPLGDEMGRAQIFQAQAAEITPDVRMNPVLLKPTSDRKSQVIVMGRVLRDMDAMEYHEFKPQLQQTVFTAFSELAGEFDTIVLEGAGSPAEINLRDRDIVNMGMAQLINAPVILVADIDRGGVFASIYGTIALLREEEKPFVKGVIINKFRGDIALLEPGIKQIEDLTGVPVLGVVPYLDVDLEEEDGVALQPEKLRRQLAQDGETTPLDIAVIRLPHISNFTDFNALAAQPDVALRYVTRAAQLGKPDLVILPGSKNTIGDLCQLNEQGISAAIQVLAAAGTPVLGICGGYQMLGKKIVDGVESGLEQINGLGLLDCVTHFARQKHTTQVKARIAAHQQGLLAGATDITLHGYEIHMGETILGDTVTPFAQLTERNGASITLCDGAVSQSGLVCGSYIHGMFDDPLFTRRFLNQLRARKQLAPLADDIFNYHEYKNQQFDVLADALQQALDIPRLKRIMQDMPLSLMPQPQRTCCGTNQEG